jgi:hypothetical protein
LSASWFCARKKRLRFLRVQANLSLPRFNSTSHDPELIFSSGFVFKTTVHFLESCVLMDILLIRYSVT